MEDEARDSELRGDIGGPGKAHVGYQASGIKSDEKILDLVPQHGGGLEEVHHVVLGRQHVEMLTALGQPSLRAGQPEVEHADAQPRGDGAVHHFLNSSPVLWGHEN